MKKGNIGGLLSKGLSVEEIQQLIKDFPDNPKIEDFIRLGYKSSTAKLYKCWLNKNEKLKLKQKISKKEDQEKDIIRSKKADENNLILDTCSLHSKQCIDIIENSKKVTVLLATVDEFDKIIHQHKNGKKFDESFICNIRKFSRKIFEDKYVLAETDCPDEYVDKSIIKYIKNLPTERPTLITMDIRLAARAKACGMEYILYMEPTNKFKIIKDFNVDIKIYPNHIILNRLSKKSYCFCVIGDICIELNKLQEVHEVIDYMVIAHKKDNRVSTVKVTFSNEKIIRKCFTLEAQDIKEIYKKMHDIHPEIIQKIVNLF